MEDFHKDENGELRRSSSSSNLLISSVISLANDIWNNCSSSSIEVVDCESKKRYDAEAMILRRKFGIKPSFVKLTPISTDQKFRWNLSDICVAENNDTVVAALSNSIKKDEEAFESSLNSFKLEYISDDDVEMIESSFTENNLEFGRQEKRSPRQRFEGDLVWAKIKGKVWWPAQITLNARAKDFKRVNLQKSSAHKNTFEYNVTVFESFSKSYWVSEKNLLDFRGRKHFEDYVSSLTQTIQPSSCNKPLKNNFWIKPTVRKRWEEFVKNVEDNYKSLIEEQKKRDLELDVQEQQEKVKDLAGDVEKCRRTRSPGAIVWAKLPGTPWWPARITKEQESQNFQRTILIKTKPTVEFHITTFGKLPTYSWIKSSRLKNFRGGKKFKNYIKNVLIRRASDSRRYARLKKLYHIPRKFIKEWNKIVKEVEKTRNTEIKERRRSYIISQNVDGSIDKSLKRSSSRCLGDIVWVKLTNKPWWPAQISKDKKSGDFKRTVLLKSCNLVQYHVTTFGSSSKSVWVRSSRSHLMNFLGKKNFNDYVKEVLSRRPLLSPSYERLKKIYDVPFAFSKKWKKVVKNVENTFKEQIERDLKIVQLSSKVLESDGSLQSKENVYRRSSRLQPLQPPKKTVDYEIINVESDAENSEKGKPLILAPNEKQANVESLDENVPESRKLPKKRFRHRFVGELVWAKLKDRPWWPAKISEDLFGEFKRVRGLKYESSISYHVTTFDKPSKNGWVVGTYVMDFKGRKAFEDYVNGLLHPISSVPVRVSYLQWKFSIKEKFRKKWEEAVKVVEDNFLIPVRDGIKTEETEALKKNDSLESTSVENVEHKYLIPVKHRIEQKEAAPNEVDFLESASVKSVEAIQESVSKNIPESDKNVQKDNIHRLPGDLIWVKTVNRPWWPAQISTEKESGNFKRSTFKAGKFLEYHVTLFCTPVVCCWALAGDLLDFRGRRNFENYKKSLLRLIPLGSRSCRQLERRFSVKNDIRNTWESMVKHTESLYNSQSGHQVEKDTQSIEPPGGNDASIRPTCTKEIVYENDRNDNYVLKIIKYTDIQMSCDELTTDQKSKLPVSDVEKTEAIIKDKQNVVETSSSRNRVLNDLVWSKISNDEWWPAQITKDEEWGDFQRIVFVSKCGCKIQYHITTFGAPAVNGWVLGDRLLDFQTKKRLEEITLSFLRTVSCNAIRTGLKPCVNEEFCKKWEIVLKNVEDTYLIPLEKKIKKDLEKSSKERAICFELKDAQDEYLIDQDKNHINYKRCVGDLVWVKSPGRPWWPAQISKCKESNFKRLYQESNGSGSLYVQYYVTTFGKPSVNYWSVASNFMDFLGLKMFMDLNLKFSMYGVHFENWLKLVKKVEGIYKDKIEVLKRDFQNKADKCDQNGEINLKKRKLPLDNEIMCISLSKKHTPPKNKILSQNTSSPSKTQQMIVVSRNKQSKNLE